MLRTNCCHCKKDIMVDIPKNIYEANRNILQSCSCNECVSENSPARDGINESIYPEKKVIAVGFELANKGLVVVVKRANDVIEEYVDKVFLIFGINDTPIDSTRFGSVYRKDKLDYIDVDLYTKETFKMLLEKGIISHDYIPEIGETSNWLLSHLIQFEKELPTDMLDYIFENNPNYDVGGWLTLIENAKIGDWLLSKGASLENTPGYGSPRQLWENHNRKDLIEHFFG